MHAQAYYVQLDCGLLILRQNLIFRFQFFLFGAVRKIQILKHSEQEQRQTETIELYYAYIRCHQVHL